MEYFDVLDENGNKTGEKKLRENVHRDGNWHRGVFVFVINSKKEIMLQKRSATKDRDPNMWTVSVTGHLSSGDDSSCAAVRETKEEIGVKVNSDKMEYLFTIKEQQIPKKGFIDNEFIDVYWLLMDIDIQEVKVQKAEVEEVKWIPYEDFRTMVKNRDKTLVEHNAIYEKLFELLEERLSV